MMQVCGSGPMITKREVSCDVDLDPGDYVIVPSTFDPGNNPTVLSKTAIFPGYR